jgi:hypothetical protein
MEGDNCPHPGLYRCFDCKGYVCEEHGRVHFPMPARKHWEEEKQRMWEHSVALMKENGELRARIKQLEKV